MARSGCGGFILGWRASSSQGWRSIRPERTKASTERLTAGGVGVELTPVDIVTTRLSGAAMAATVSSRATQSSFYGIEVDLEVEVEAADFLVFSAQGAIFRPGQYFGDLPAGYEVLAAPHLLLP